MKPHFRTIHIVAILIVAILIVALSSLQFSEPCFAQKRGKAKIESLLAELNKHRAGDTTRVNLLSDVSSAFSAIDPDKGIEYALDGIRLAEKIHFRNGLGENFLSAGECFGFKSDYLRAMDYYSKALEIFSESGYQDGAARSINKVGIIFSRQANFPKALEYYFRSLRIYEELGSKSGSANVFLNIANVYFSQSDFRKVLEYDFKALKIAEELGDLDLEARISGAIGNAYSRQADFPKALEFHNKALKLNEKLGIKSGVARDLGNIGLVYKRQYDFPKALEYYSKSLEINKELKLPIGLMNNLGAMGSLYLQMAIDSTKRSEFVNTALSRINKAQYLNKSVEYSSKAAEIAFERHSDDILILCYQNLSQAHKELGNWRSAYEFWNKGQALKDSIFSFENNKKIANLEAKRETELKEKELIIFRERDKQQKMLIWFAAGGALLLLVFSFFVWRERGKSEKLLLNILPAKIAARLKKKEKYIADHFDSASVVFFDISEFTKLTKNTKPERVVEVLNRLYTEFDHIADRHGLEKIKTIGDCYMAVAGIPEARNDHAQCAAAFASEAMAKLNGHKTEDGTEIFFKAGVDCGPVIAGVIGERKFIYDLWGDTVNTASRMEEYGEPGRIHVTGRFKEALEEPLAGQTAWSFTGRGELEVRGHGAITTWWMEAKE